MSSVKTTQRIALWLGFALVLMLAAYLRFVAATTTIVDYPIRNDAKDYVAYSVNWKYAGTYSRAVTWMPDPSITWPPKEHFDKALPDAVRPPGYPAFLRLFVPPVPGPEFVRTAMLVQAGMGVLIVAIVFLLARVLFSSAVAALLAMLLAALSPHLIVMETYLLSETLYTLLLVIGVGTSLWAMRCEKEFTQRGAAAVCGALLALCCLVRPTLEQLPWIVLSATLLVPRLRPYRTWILCGFLGFVAVMAPWWIRNLGVIGHLTDSSLMAQSLHHGSYPDFMYNGDRASFGQPYAYDPDTKNAEASVSSAVNAIVQKFAAEPGRYAYWYTIGKIKFFFDWVVVRAPQDIFTYPELATPFRTNKFFVLVHAIMFGLHWPLVIAGLLGMVSAWTRLPRAIFAQPQIHGMRLLSALLAYAILVHIAVAPFARYSIPFRPLTYLLALMTLLIGAKWIRELRRKVPVMT